MAKQSSDLPTLSAEADLKRQIKELDPRLREPHVNKIFDQYRKFWAVVKQPSDNRRFLPPSDVDVVWHVHMAMPKMYLLDCFRYFKGVLDHGCLLEGDRGDLEENNGYWESELRAALTKYISTSNCAGGGRGVCLPVVVSIGALIDALVAQQ